MSDLIHHWLQHSVPLRGYFRVRKSIGSYLQRSVTTSRGRRVAASSEYFERKTRRAFFLQRCRRDQDKRPKNLGFKDFRPGVNVHQDIPTRRSEFFRLKHLTSRKTAQVFYRFLVVGYDPQDGYYPNESRSTDHEKHQKHCHTTARTYDDTTNEWNRILEPLYTRMRHLPRVILSIASKR